MLAGFVATKDQKALFSLKGDYRCSAEKERSYRVALDSLELVADRNVVLARLQIADYVFKGTDMEHEPKTACCYHGASVESGKLLAIILLFIFILLVSTSHK